MAKKQSKKRVVRRPKQPQSIISDEIIIPNHSGMLDAGVVHRVPTDDLDPVNKKYVDDETHWERTGTNVHLKTSTDSVGIGTDSPSSKLDIRASGQAAITLYDTATDEFSTIRQRESDGNFEITRLGTGGTDFQIQPDGDIILGGATGGNVGIGTTSPSRKLTVDGDILLKTGTNKIYGANNANQFIEPQTAAGAMTAASIGNICLNIDSDNNSAAHYFGIYKDSTNQSGAQLFKVQEDGKVGIGTATPAVTFHVNGAVRNQELNDTTNFLQTLISNDIVYFDSYGTAANSGGFHFRTNDATVSAMRIKADGKVGIGVTDPHSKLEVNGAISSSVKTITASSDAVNVAGVNTVFINPSAAVVIGGFAGGVAGQRVDVVVITATQNVTMEDMEASGTQKLRMHQSADETLNSERGGWSFVFDGTYWYDVSHARHV